jgi:hypothetical protein
MPIPITGGQEPRPGAGAAPAGIRRRSRRDAGYDEMYEDVEAFEAALGQSLGDPQ